MFRNSGVQRGVGTPERGDAELKGSTPRDWDDSAPRPTKGVVYEAI